MPFMRVRFEYLKRRKLSARGWTVAKYWFAEEESPSPLRGADGNNEAIEPDKDNDGVQYFNVHCGE